MKGNKGNTGIKRILMAAKYSLQGLQHAIRFEAAFRQELLLAALLIPLACWMDVSQTQRMLLIGSVLIVLIVELLNSGIESTVDRIAMDHHELAGRAKDLASAAVFMSLVLAGYVWLEVLFF